MVETLISWGASVDVRGGLYGSALQAACVYNTGRTRTIELLLTAGANVNIQEGQYNSALQAACAALRMYAVELLLENGARVNAEGGRHGSALQAVLQTQRVKYYSYRNEDSDPEKDSDDEGAPGAVTLID